jgi:signal transduction histidine kinase
MSPGPTFPLSRTLDLSITRRVLDDALPFRLLFEQSPDTLLVLLPDAPRFTMVAATQARYAATHTSAEQTIGRGLFELFPDNPDDAAATGMANLRASLDRVLATRAPDSMAVQKYDIRMPDGTFAVKYWSPRNLPVLSSAGEVLYILHRVEDVTELVLASEAGERLRDRTQAMEREVIHRSRELHDALQQLREANAKLGELDAAKTVFFSNVSHEFRTPLTLMLGPLEDALSDASAPLPPAHKTRVQLAYDSSLRLLKLVNALLDFSRIEAGRMRASYAPRDISQLTAELAGMFQSAVERAGIRLEVDCPRIAEPVFVDRDMWEKIVTNLLSNAFKFTLQGAITVRVREAASSVFVEVADTGVGIPEAELPKIFDRFHRVAGTSGRTHEGTGIGLALVQELVRLHGGSIAATSTLGQGTTFRVELPKGSAHLPEAQVARVAEPHEVRRESAALLAEVDAMAGRAQAPSAPGLQPAGADSSRARVLVVDDNPDVREYMAGLLATRYDVTTAVDGQAALEALTATDTKPPDIVVSDVMMPRLDGVGLVRALRARQATAQLPVVLLSARAGEEATVEGLDAGADDYLVKPFSARELLARVRTHVNLARARKAWMEELERANRELDAFSYSVSHDLRAPLRAIEGFSTALAEDYGSTLEQGAQDYLERIRRNVLRMTVLIDDLLDLARIARAPVAREQVDLSALAAEVVADLRQAQPDRTVDVEISPQLIAHGDRRLLRVVLINLIGNAWKYTSRTAAAHIEIGRADGERDDTFFVRDNGAGFDMAHASQLFTPFQRLHDAKEFEGTGVGLATVQRVIHRHGGRIWATAAPQQGATFHFSLPPGPSGAGSK